MSARVGSRRGRRRLPRAASPAPCPSVLTEHLLELAVSSSTPWCFPFAKRFSESRSLSSPASLFRPAMEPPCLMAGLPPGPLVEQGPSDQSSTAEIRTYLFAAILFKRPWQILYLTRGPWRPVQKPVFQFGKRKPGRFEQNALSAYLQDCHWFCFAHKIFILIPFLSIQIALGS